MLHASVSTCFWFCQLGMRPSRVPQVPSQPASSNLKRGPPRQTHEALAAEPSSPAQKKPRHGKARMLDPASPRAAAATGSTLRSAVGEACMPQHGSRAPKRARSAASPEGQGRASELPGDALPLPLHPPEPLKHPCAHAVRWSQNQLDMHLQTVLMVLKVRCLMICYCLVLQTSLNMCQAMIFSCAQGATRPDSLSASTFRDLPYACLKKHRWQIARVLQFLCKPRAAGRSWRSGTVHFPNSTLHPLFIGV